MKQYFLGKINVTGTGAKYVFLVFKMFLVKNWNSGTRLLKCEIFCVCVLLWGKLILVPRITINNRQTKRCSQKLHKKK